MLKIDQGDTFEIIQEKIQDEIYDKVVEIFANIPNINVAPTEELIKALEKIKVCENTNK